MAATQTTAAAKKNMARHERQNKQAWTSRQKKIKKISASVTCGRKKAMKAWRNAKNGDALEKINIKGGEKEIK